MSDSATLKKRLAYYKRCLDNYEKSLGTDPSALKTAAQFFGFDPANESHRQLLLYILADAVFGKRKGRPVGTNSAWPRKRRLVLFFACEKIKDRHPELSDAKIVEELCKNRHFKNEDAGTLRQRLIVVRREVEGERRRMRRPGTIKSPTY